MDPVVGLVGTGVILSWAWGLARDAGAVLLDTAPDPTLAGTIRELLEVGGDRVSDLHLWRVGPGEHEEPWGAQAAAARSVLIALSLARPGYQRSNVARRLGMKLEATLRENYPWKGVRHDTEIWAVLAPDWR